MHKALLLIAHGSRRTSSNQEIIDLAQKIANATSEFDHVKGCFLEMAEPSINAAIDELVEQKIEHIYVLPYFLAAGRHVIEDVPEFIDKAKKQHPQVKFELISYFGSSENIVSSILTHALA